MMKNVKKPTIPVMERKQKVKKVTKQWIQCFPVSDLQESVQSELDTLIRGSREWEDKIVKSVTGLLYDMF